MLSNVVLTAIVAAAGVSAQTDPCTASNGFTINSQADITKLGTCTTLKGNVAVGRSGDSELDFGTIQGIQGDFIVSGNPAIQQLKGASLGTITGKFGLSNLTALTSVNFPGLTTVGSIEFQSLAALSELGFTSGIKTAKSVIVADTRLTSLKGLEMRTASIFDINNNNLLVEWESKLDNLTDKMSVTVNGLNFKLSLPNLKWISNMTIANCSSFSAPSLAAVNGSIRYDFNFFESVSLPNLTTVTSGDVAFVGNSKLTNITAPQLTGIGGGFTIANNTALQVLDGFPKLKTVGGAVALRGNFTGAALPGLSTVRGTFDLKSTTDVAQSCDTLKKLAPQSQGGGGQIEGRFNCSGFVANANSDTSNAGGSGGGNGGNRPPNAAGTVVANTIYVVGAGVMALVAGSLL